MIPKSIAEQECSICLTQIGNDQIVKENICPHTENAFHVFHGECLDEWSQTKKTCPICRAEMFNYVEAPEFIKQIGSCITIAFARAMENSTGYVADWAEACSERLQKEIHECTTLNDMRILIKNIFAFNSRKKSFFRLFSESDVRKTIKAFIQEFIYNIDIVTSILPKTFLYEHFPILDETFLQILQNPGDPLIARL